MFVRLKKRKPCQSDIMANDVSYSIVVVQSFWDEQKKPRQKFIKYLGSIKESELKNPSAYNNYIDEIMKYVGRAHKGYITVGEHGGIINRDEFKKLIHTAFTNVGTRIVNKEI